MNEDLEKFFTEKNFDYFICRVVGTRIGWLKECYEYWDMNRNGYENKTFIGNHERFKKIYGRSYSTDTFRRFINGTFSDNQPFKKRCKKITEFINNLSKFSGVPVFTFIDENIDSDKFREIFHSNWEKQINTNLHNSKPLQNNLEKSFINLPVTDNIIFGRDNYLSFLDDTWVQNNANILVLIAPGGVGKTSLLNKWLFDLSKNNYNGAEVVYGYSFYQQESHEKIQSLVDIFLYETLMFFDDPEPLKGNSLEKTHRLINLIKKKRTLLIIDGVEVLQSLLDEKVGIIKNKSFEYFLKGIITNSSGLCIITTRIQIYNIKHMVDSKNIINIENLPVDAGVSLLKKLGVKGNTDEFEDAVKEFGCNALALKLLGSYLRIIHNGYIKKRHKIVLLMDEKIEGEHAKRIIKSYEKSLKKDIKGKIAIELLCIISIFVGKPIKDVILILLKTNIKGLNDNINKISTFDFKYTVNYLIDLGLLSGEVNNFDCHFLVKEYFREHIKINLETWKKANKIFFNYYNNKFAEILINSNTYHDLFLYAVNYNLALHHSNEANFHFGLSIFESFSKDEYIKTKFMLPSIANKSNFHYKYDMTLNENDLLPLIGYKLVINAISIHSSSHEKSEAEILYKKALNIFEEFLGEKHYDVAITSFNLAFLYHFESNYKDAEILYKKALNIFEKQDVINNRKKIIKICKNLAILYRSIGKNDKLEDLYFKIITIGFNKFDYITTSDLATLYRDQGRYKESEDMYKIVLSTLQDHFNYDSLKIANTLEDLGKLYYFQERYKEAESYYKKSLAILENHYSKNHVSLISLLINLAHLYREQKEYVKGEQKCDRALKIIEYNLSLDIYDIMLIQYIDNIAYFFELSNDFERSDILYKKVLNSYEIIHSNNNKEYINIAITLNNWARLYESNGKYVKAESLYKKSLRLFEKNKNYDYNYQKVKKNYKRVLDLLN